ncbi:hypothetical protein EAX61_03200 [Dokdonia sinensis]|uniref:Uncharacterized protein n=1 Tax=Dokdonia sinensis TaxID=2479847 RepID=A0A3M0GE22_9FLAO|nr:hypothetical protein [Dokdonia sinensis]RMB63411.1 hypothetical protein EAX61_03200 [Dokdonia sinensis]
MKKTIKAELVSLAHKILQLRDTADYAQMATQARELQDKLTILAYAEKLEKMGMPTIGLKEIEEEITLSRKRDNNDTIPEEVAEIEEQPATQVAPKKEQAPAIKKKSKTPAEIRAENQARYEKAKGTDEADRHRPDGTQFNKEEPLHEPVIEKIKDMWPEMTPEAAEIDKVIESIIPQQPAVGKNDSFEIGNEYQMPIFERKDTTIEEVDDKPKNLNDRLKTGLKIGLNDKLSFIKHLFNGSASDYNRVLSQLETFQTATEARQFIIQMIKPDYNNWEGKEVQEERFMEIVEGRYS